MGQRCRACLTSFCHSSQDLIQCKMQGALDGKTTHVVCASFVSFHSNRLHSCTTNYRIMEENSVKHVPPDGFFGIQILPNSISAGALPRIPLGELTMLPRPSSQLGVLPTVPHHFSKPSLPLPQIYIFVKLASLRRAPIYRVCQRRRRRPLLLCWCRDVASTSELSCDVILTSVCGLQDCRCGAADGRTQNGLF